MYSYIIHMDSGMGNMWDDICWFYCFVYGSGNVRFGHVSSCNCGFGYGCVGCVYFCRLTSVIV